MGTVGCIVCLASCKQAPQTGMAPTSYEIMKVEATDKDGWYYFDLVPGEYEIRDGEADYTGKVCVIGAGLDREKLSESFK